MNFKKKDSGNKEPEVPEGKTRVFMWSLLGSAVAAQTGSKTNLYCKGKLLLHKYIVFKSAACSSTSIHTQL